MPPNYGTWSGVFVFAETTAAETVGFPDGGSLTGNHHYQATENLSTTCCVGGHGRDEASWVGIYNWIAEEAVHMQFGYDERGSHTDREPIPQ
jgi:hypothetical protein